MEQRGAAVTEGEFPLSAADFNTIAMIILPKPHRRLRRRCLQR